MKHNKKMGLIKETYNFESSVSCASSNQHIVENNKQVIDESTLKVKCFNVLE